MVAGIVRVGLANLESARPTCIVARGPATEGVGVADLESAWPTWPETGEIGLTDWKSAQSTLSRRPALSCLTEGKLDPC